MSVVGLAAVAGPASAGTIYVNSYVVPNDINVHSTFPPTISNEYSGSGQIVLQAGPSVSGPFSALDTWCVDLFDTLYTPTVYQTGPLVTNGGGGVVTPTQVGQIGALMAHGDSMLASGHYTPGFSANEVSSAIQIAIWTVEYGNTYSFVSDDGLLNGSGRLVATYVSNVTGGTPIWAPYDDVVTISTPDDLGTTNQRLAFLRAPEPMSLGLLASGLLGLGFVRRRAA